MLTFEAVLDMFQSYLKEDWRKKFCPAGAAMSG